jgi:hypothetical protein
MASVVRLAILPAFAFLAVACGNSACTFRRSPESEANLHDVKKPAVKMAAKLVDARIQPAWQEAFSERAAALGAVEAWGLFSDAGYADDGQIMIFALGDGTATVEVVSPGGRAPKVLLPVSAADLLQLRKELGGLDELEDFVEPSFDGIRREAVHMVRVADSGPLDVKTRIMIVRVSSNQAPRHMAVVDSFARIRKERTKR